MGVIRLKLLSTLLSLPKTLASLLVTQATSASTLKILFSTEFFKCLVVGTVQQQPETLAMVTNKQLLTQLMQELTLEIQNY